MNIYLYKISQNIVMLRYNEPPQNIKHRQAKTRCQCQQYQSEEIGTHSWKCYVNRDVNLQYHEIMLNSKSSKSKEPRIKTKEKQQNCNSYRLKDNQPSTPKNNRFISQQYMGTKIKCQRSKDKAQRPNKDYLLQKNYYGYGRDVYSQKYLNNQAFHNRKTKQHKNNIRNYEYDSNKQIKQEKQEGMISRTSSLKTLRLQSETDEESLLKNNRKKLSINPKIIIQNTTCYQSSDETISHQTEQLLPKQRKRLFISSSNMLPENNFKRKQKGLAQHNSRLSEKIIQIRAKTMIIKNIDVKTANEQYFKPQLIPQTIDKQIQTRDMVMLKPHVYQMQQQQRKYLREQFINHYGLSYKKKF